MIEHGVVFAAHYERKTSQIGQDGPGAILPIEPQQSVFLRELRGSEGATDGCQGLAPFFAGCARCRACQTNRAIGSCEPG